MIRNVVFDIGRVLFDYHPKDVVKTLLPHRQDVDFFVTNFHDAQVWQDLDGGKIFPSDAADLVNELHDENIRSDILHIIHHFHSVLPPIIPMIDLLHQVSKTHQVFLLTNFQDQPFDRLCEMYSFLTQVNGEVVSAKERCMKPELKIYNILLTRYQLVPEETLFIDDKLENIQAAERCGIQGVVHTSVSETLEKVQLCLSSLQPY